jgi:hypothetical protein
MHMSDELLPLALAIQEMCENFEKEFDLHIKIGMTQPELTDALCEIENIELTAQIEGTIRNIYSYDAPLDKEGKGSLRYTVFEQVKSEMEATLKQQLIANIVW